MEYNLETFLAIVKRKLLFRQRTSLILDFDSKGTGDPKSFGILY
jgi:hypothetical protein